MSYPSCFSPQICKTKLELIVFHDQAVFLHKFVRKKFYPTLPSTVKFECCAPTLTTRSVGLMRGNRMWLISGMTYSLCALVGSCCNHSHATMKMSISRSWSAVDWKHACIWSYVSSGSVLSRAICRMFSPRTRGIIEHIYTTNNWRKHDLYLSVI